MLPGHLEIGNRETDVVVPPRLSRSTQLGGKVDGQWGPPTTTIAQEAKLYAIDEYYAPDRWIHVKLLWIVEWLLMLCLLTFCIASVVLQPRWYLLLDARNDLVLQNLPSSRIESLLSTFDILIPPFFLTSIFVYLIVGTVPLLLAISSWNIGSRATKDVIHRNCFLHELVLALCIGSLLSTGYLHVSWVFFNKERTEWMINSQALLEGNMTHNETFLGKLERDYKCCGFATPKDYWTLEETGEFQLGSKWFAECSEALYHKKKICPLPDTCSGALKFKAVILRKNRTSQSYYYEKNKKFQKWFTRIEKRTDLGCDERALPSTYIFYYFTGSYSALLLCIFQCIFIILSLTVFSIRKRESELLDWIHQSSENKRKYEIWRLEEKSKQLSSKDKEIFVTPYVYSKDTKESDDTVEVEPMGK